MFFLNISIPRNQVSRASRCLLEGGVDGSGDIFFEQIYSTKCVYPPNPMCAKGMPNIENRYYTIHRKACSKDWCRHSGCVCGRHYPGGSSGPCGYRTDGTEVVHQSTDVCMNPGCMGLPYSGGVYRMFTSTPNYAETLGDGSKFLRVGLQTNRCLNQFPAKTRC